MGLGPQRRFQDVFTMTLTPSGSNERPRRILRRIVWLFDRPTRRRFALALVGSVCLALAEVAAVVLVLPLMELILNQPGGNGLLLRLKRLFGFPEPGRLAIYIATIVFLGFLLKGIASILIRWWTLGFINRQGVRSAEELLAYYLRAPISLHVRRGTADLLRMLGESVSQVYGQVIGGGMNIATESITIAAMAGTLLVVDPLPTLAVTAYFGLAGFLLQRSIKRHALKAGTDLIHYSYLTGQTALQALGGIKEIKLRNQQDEFVEQYTKSRRVVAQSVRMTTFLSDVPKYVLELVFILGIGIMTALVYVQQQSSSALATLALFAVAGSRVLPSTVRLLASINVFRSGLPALDLLEIDLAQARAKGMTRPSPQAEPLAYSYDVELKGVCFRYDDSDVDVLREISLSVPAGRSLALVGSSGAGKSTLIDLLLGLQRPTEGAIFVDGTDIADKIPQWQQNLAMVPQDVYLLDTSLRDNIRFSPRAEDPGDERLTRVLRQARLDDLVAELPDGVHTQVGDRGMRLSGGQRQRVGIARALFREPRLLVLDEATSALDNETERQVTETIGRLSGEVSVVVVAHRLSTVRRCDRLIYLEDGRVVATGTFEEVREASSSFAHMVELGSLTFTSSEKDVAS